MDMERQSNLARYPVFIVPEQTRFHDHKLRRPFTRARCSEFPSMVMGGQYKRIPFAQTLSQCDSGEVESIQHVFLGCPWYQDAQAEYILPLTKALSSLSESNYISYLSDKTQAITADVAKFYATCCSIQKDCIISLQAL